MWSPEKKLNKWIVWAIIGSTIIGLWSLSMTPKGKSFRRRMSDRGKRWNGYFSEGLKETIKIIKKIKGE